MKKIVVLGASGNIGLQTLQLLKTVQNQFRIVAISVGQNIAILPDIIRDFPSIEGIWIQNDLCVSKLCQKYPEIKWYSNMDGMNCLLDDCGNAIVVNAISGFAGLHASLCSLQTKRCLLLANKESLVIAGNTVKALAKQSNSKIIPIDSEHSAIWQCLESKHKINRILLTASGGPFRNLTLEETKNVTLEQTLRHPNWTMGTTITVDSATMMNKAYEMLEAYHLFETKKIEVLIHPESLIHSMVEYEDYTIKAVMSKPDMKQVIWYALNYPNRKSNILLEPMNFTNLVKFSLQTIDDNRFSAIKMAKKCLEHIESNSLTIGLNALNEVVRQAFLMKKISFSEIIPLIESHFYRLEMTNFTTYETICGYNDKIKSLIKI